MSFKTDRLVALFADAHAVHDRSSLLYQWLDAVGAELMQGDASIKRLLRSHWIDHAEGGGLDGLAAMFGVERRLLPGGQPEGDDTFRPLVKSIARSFVGGGTVEALRAAVRAALGLPGDLKIFEQQLTGLGGRRTPEIAALVQGLDALVQVEEFAPRQEEMLGQSLASDGGSELMIEIDSATVEGRPPRIEWSFTQGAGRQLSVTRLDTGTGVRSLPRPATVVEGTAPELVVAQGETLLLAGGGADFSASIGSLSVTEAFQPLGAGSRPGLPTVPEGHSRWLFRAGAGATFDDARFDASESLDAPAFSVRMTWQRLQPLVFDVVVPYFVDIAVQRLLARSGQKRRIRLFKGLSLDAIQRVVDEHRAAGVQGGVQYAIALPGESTERSPWDDQAMREQFSAQLTDRHDERHDMDEDIFIGALDTAAERHDAAETFVIGGNFNVAVFDGSFGFL